MADIRLKIPRANETPTVAHEMIPTKEELQRVFNARNIRPKVAVAFAAFTSVRPEVLGKGSAGLTLGDILDLEWDNEGKTVSFRNIPSAVRVGRALSKVGHEYITFLNAQGCGYLKQYLEKRLRDGERFSPETAVLTMHHRTLVQDRPKVGDRVTKKRGDFVHTQHVRALLKSARYLETTGAAEGTRDSVLGMIRRELLVSAGSSKEEVEKLSELSTMPQDEFEKLLDRKWQEKFGLGNGNKQKVVPKAEVRALIADGWEFVTWLDDIRSEAIVRLPSR